MNQDVKLLDTPDMEVVENLVFEHERAVRHHAMALGVGIGDLRTTRAALLDYVCDHFGDADKMVQPVGEVPMPEAIGRLYFGGVSCGELDEWEFDAHQGVCDRINESAITESLQGVYLHRDVRAYGDAREASGYAAGVAAGGEVPMPEPAYLNAGFEGWGSPLRSAYSEDDMRTYGEQCRAAGYAAGVAAAGRDADQDEEISRLKDALRHALPFMKNHGMRLANDYNSATSDATRDKGTALVRDAEIYAALIDRAALCKEVKP